MDFERNELNKDSNGGTEQIMSRLFRDVPEDLLNKFQIIPSRVRDLKEDKRRVLCLHDLPNDPEAKAALVSNGGWARFHRLVFVSHWQRQAYLNEYKEIPWSKTAVIPNSIEPFDIGLEKPTDRINVIYHTTPHRGLNVLVPVFKRLQEKYGDKIHLDVFSSFELYGTNWKGRDEQFMPLYDDIRKTEGMTYHGYQPNAVVRATLEKSHIFAYPSIWPETSCISLIEAMGAGLICVHPDYAALPETSANWTFMYNWHEDINKHAGIFNNVLDTAIEVAIENNEKKNMINRLKSQVGYVNLYNNWETKKHQWEAFLQSFVDEPTEMQKSQRVFQYRA